MKYSQKKLPPPQRKSKKLLRGGESDIGKEKAEILTDFGQLDLRESDFDQNTIRVEVPTVDILEPKYANLRNHLGQLGQEFGIKWHGDVGLIYIPPDKRDKRPSHYRVFQNVVSAIECKQLGVPFKGLDSTVLKHVAKKPQSEFRVEVNGIDGHLIKQEISLVGRELAKEKANKKKTEEEITKNKNELDNLGDDDKSKKKELIDKNKLLKDKSQELSERINTYKREETELKEKQRLLTGPEPSTVSAEPSAESDNNNAILPLGYTKYLQYKFKYSSGKTQILDIYSATDKILLKCNKDHTGSDRDKIELKKGDKFKLKRESVVLTFEKLDNQKLKIMTKTEDGISGYLMPDKLCEQFIDYETSASVSSTMIKLTNKILKDRLANDQYKKFISLHKYDTPYGKQTLLSNNNLIIGDEYDKSDLDGKIDSLKVMLDGLVLKSLSLKNTKLTKGGNTLTLISAPFKTNTLTDFSHKNYYKYLVQQHPGGNLSIYLTNGINKQFNSGGGGTNKGIKTIGENMFGDDEALFNHASMTSSQGFLFQDKNKFKEFITGSSGGVALNSSEFYTIATSSGQQTSSQNFSGSAGKLSAGEFAVLPGKKVTSSGFIPNVNSSNIDIGVYHINGIDWSNTNPKVNDTKYAVDATNFAKLYYGKIIDDFAKNRAITSSGNILHLATIPGINFGGTKTSSSGMTSAIKDYFNSSGNLAKNMTFVLGIDENSFNNIKINGLTGGSRKRKLTRKNFYYWRLANKINKTNKSKKSKKLSRK